MAHIPIPVTVYRSMRVGSDGHPEPGRSARTLGIRPGIDVEVDDEGNVHPGREGLSVAPRDPLNLPPWRRPPRFGGDGKDPVWALTELPAGLAYVATSGSHGVLSPAVTMTLEVYEELLASTAPSWHLVGT